MHRTERVDEACISSDAVVSSAAPRASTAINLGGDENFLAPAKTEDAGADVALTRALAVVIRGVQVAETG